MDLYEISDIVPLNLWQLIGGDIEFSSAYQLFDEVDLILFLENVRHFYWRSNWLESRCFNWYLSWCPLRIKLQKFDTQINWIFLGGFSGSTKLKLWEFQGKVQRHSFHGWNTDSLNEHFINQPKGPLTNCITLDFKKIRYKIELWLDFIYCQQASDPMLVIILSF